MRSTIFVVLNARVTSPGHFFRSSSQYASRRKNLVRIDHIAMLIDRADAVGIAIRNQPRIALLRDNRLLRRLDMRQNRLGIDPRKRRIDLAANLHKRNPRLREDARNHTTPRPIHIVDQKLVPRRANRIEINKPAIAATYSVLKSTSSIAAGVTLLRQRLYPDSPSIAVMIDGFPDPP